MVDFSTLDNLKTNMHCFSKAYGLLPATSEVGGFKAKEKGVVRCVLCRRLNLLIQAAILNLNFVGKGMVSQCAINQHLFTELT